MTKKLKTSIVFILFLLFGFAVGLGILMGILKSIPTASNPYEYYD